VELLGSIRKRQGLRRGRACDVHILSGIELVGRC
jgi:hypothetical protein